jgi:hypothetical protein
VMVCLALFIIELKAKMAQEVLTCEGVSRFIDSRT